MAELGAALCNEDLSTAVGEMSEVLLMQYAFACVYMTSLQVRAMPFCEHQ